MTWISLTFLIQLTAGQIAREHRAEIGSGNGEGTGYQEKKDLGATVPQGIARQSHADHQPHLNGVGFNHGAAQPHQGVDAGALPASTRMPTIGHQSALSKTTSVALHKASDDHAAIMNETKTTATTEH